LVSEEGDAHYGELLIQNPRTCPLCQGQFLEACFVERSEYDVHNITAKDLWLAVNGLGLPEERKFSDTEIVGLLTEHKIVFVSAKMKRTGRVLIESLTLKNGKRLSFGDGAVIYKIEEV
jgi:hypothetical protein